MKRSTVTEDAIGKWPSILNALGIDKRFLVNRHGPCPLCDGGKDRFRFDDKEGKGSWYCSQCGAGDGWSLLMKLKGWDFKRCVQEVEPLIGTASPVAVRRGRDERVVRGEMNALWRSGRPLTDVQATALWWAKRTGDIPRCRDIRAVASALCPNEGRFPAMIALIRAPDGSPANLHRTFLTDRGEKAPFDAPRRVMDMPMPKGSAVRLREVTGERMGVAEGLETAEAAAILHDIPVWATINAVNMEGFVPPEGVKEIVVFGDNDSNFAGQKAAAVLANRLANTRKDGALQYRVSLAIPGWETPKPAAEDWDDVLMRRIGTLEDA